MRLLFPLAACLRIALLAYASWVDAYCELKFTDIDYGVFSDAAELVVQGRSPYQRSTYRYTPFLAILLMPNIWLPVWGKCLFCLADLAGARCGRSMYQPTFLYHASRAFEMNCDRSGCWRAC